jgi:hypothetical protein
MSQHEWHCEWCSLDGKYLGPHSLIGYLNDPAWPIRPEMTIGVYHDRGIPSQWRPGKPWRDVVCPRCGQRPWKLDSADPVAAVNADNPPYILTGAGRLTEADLKAYEAPVEGPDNYGPGGQDHVCPVCRRGYKYVTGLAKHMQREHSEVTA